MKLKNEKKCAFYMPNYEHFLEVGIICHCEFCSMPHSKTVTKPFLKVNVKR